MSAHNLTRAQAIETVNLVNQYQGNITSACRASGVARTTLQSRYFRALQILQSEIPEPFIEPVFVKPRYRVPAGRNPPLIPPSPSVLRVLQIPDAHDSPALPDKSRFKWFGMLAADIRPDVIVNIGDEADFDSISFHVRNDTQAGRLKPSFMADIESLNRAKEAMEEPIAKCSDYKPVKKKTRGNHENRIWRHEDLNPEIAGMMQVEYHAVMSKYGWEEAAYGDFVNIAGVDFVHIPLTKMLKPRGGDNASTIMARKTVRDTVVGHTHNAQQRCETKDGYDERVRVFETGTALPQGHVQKYAEHGASGWWWGVNLFTIINGRIEGWQAIPMFELQQRYG